MSDVIHLLPDSVANQIAAGEVIQRPASVIKELVENSVDAGATSITIILRDGGKNLIQVIDNGSGMSETDARLAFERHATSKISQASDLFELHTMGFRGEALPSIAAVAQIELLTMRKEDSIGTHLCLAASKFESQVPDACPVGTNLAVKNLFFNFPARRKFLKKDSVELNHIVHEFERLALVNPDKGFHLIHNDVTLHRLLPGSLKQRIVELFGKNLDKQLIPVATKTTLVNINGFVSLPENARKRNPLQYLFVNGRNMKHPYFHKAVLSCYEDLIAADHQPNFFLSFEVDPNTIDVNIHPTKSEIKFENEVPIWQILVAAIKESLGKFNAVPSIDFDSTASIEIPVFNPSANTDFVPVNLDPDYNPFAPAPAEHTSAPIFDSEAEKSAPKSTPPPRSSQSEVASSLVDCEPSSLNDWDKLYDSFRNDTPASADDLTAQADPLPESEIKSFDAAYNPFMPSSTSTPAPSPQPAENTAAQQMPEESSISIVGVVDPINPSPNTHIQFNNRYIFIPARQGIMAIDRHRAHVAVLFDRYMQLTDSGDSQQIMFPETITLSLDQHVTLESCLSEINHLGFDLSYLGDRVWAINGIPGSIGKLSPVNILLQIIDSLQQQTTSPADDMRRRVALSMAEAAAIKVGQTLSNIETEALLKAYLSLSELIFTPDGRRISFILDDSEIARRLS